MIKNTPGWQTLIQHPRVSVAYPAGPGVFGITVTIWHNREPLYHTRIDN